MIDKYIPLSDILCTKATGHIYYECPACGVPHGLRIVPSDYVKTDPDEQVWTWDGNVDAPTFMPSVVVRYQYGADRQQKLCHSFVTNGMISYLSDCTHSLKDQTVPIPKWDTALE